MSYVVIADIITIITITLSVIKNGLNQLQKVKSRFIFPLAQAELFEWLDPPYFHRGISDLVRQTTRFPTMYFSRAHL